MFVAGVSAPRLAGVLLALATGCASQQPRPVVGPDAHVEVVVRSEMSSSFRLLEVRAELDSRPIYQRQGDWEAFDRREPLKLYDGKLAMGSHELKIALRFAGHGEGVFSYLSKYRFDVEDEHHFELVGSNDVQLEVIAYEQGGATTPLEDRPALRFAGQTVR